MPRTFAHAGFLIDMILQFLMQYEDSHGQWQRLHSKIVRNYLASWFCVDLVSIFPFYIISLLSQDPSIRCTLQGKVNIGDDTASSGTLVRATQSVRVVKLLRMLKLARVLKASQVLQRVLSDFFLTRLEMTCARLPYR